ncbi:type II toxin-antitoxin system HipA family toxin [Variovorax sp. Sphag1AA]|uniref:type II toxin-antitoxin system HipA family toxin n=1 Tax=Variovorax sp. Sphag1AA TaxID=2587027 RepID=UPI001617F6BB|nr:type II toxin-antitoxin system HipA family toxin [Variovorax sp. Sphag1AA]MBB3182067.1 serine/threonine-protein kinase HipA [Variovorax sp. Sphag1AA]
MGRRSHSQSLGLWSNGERVGRWTIPARGDMELRYDDAWVRSAVGRPLSLSLPFNPHNEPLKGPSVEHYFDNLLPDSADIRKRVAARFKTGSVDAFDLLHAIGRDCVGAIQLLDEAETPSSIDQIEAVPVDDESIERHLLSVVNPDKFGGAGDPDDDFRISLAGAQEKDAFLWWNGTWNKPRGTTPTTHIFKLPLGLIGGRQADFSTSVDNEWLCLKLLQAYGLPAADATIASFGKQRVLVVERFDRRLSNGRILRLPQEDFCQATGTSPLIKYENEGGPGLSKLFSILQQSANSEDDMRTLMATQILFWLLRAPDGHAKNFSIRLLAGGAFQLTKLYDVMSAYPILGSGPNQWSLHDLKMAMALLGKNRHYNMTTIQRRHFNSTAQKVGLGRDAEDIITNLIDRTPGVIREVQAQLPKDFSPLVAERVMTGLQEAVNTLEGMPTK